MSDPKNFDKKMKNACINQNIYAAGYGTYKACPFYPTIRFSYLPNANIPDPTGIANVFTVNRHPLDVIFEITEKGTKTLDHHIDVPMVIYPMGREFIGTNYESREGIIDENIILRTNYSFLLKKSSNLLPLKTDTDILYTKNVVVIRDNTYTMLSHEQLYKMSICTVFPPNDLQLLDQNDADDNHSNKLLSSKNFITFQMIMESVFQAAICGHHRVLVLTLFPTELNIPLNDQVMIFNYNILKYGTLFKDIVIAIPQYMGGLDVIDYVDQHIVKPQEITKEVDNLFAEKQMKSSLEKKQDEPKQDERISYQQQMLNMTPDEKVIMIQEMLKNKNKKINKTI